MIINYFKKLKTLCFCTNHTQIYIYFKYTMYYTGADQATTIYPAKKSDDIHIYLYTQKLKSQTVSCITNLVMYVSVCSLLYNPIMHQVLVEAVSTWVILHCCCCYRKKPSGLGSVKFLLLIYLLKLLQQSVQRLMFFFRKYS